MDLTAAELIDILRKNRSESSALEVKAAEHRFPKSVLDTVSAFANGEGGTILLGVNDPASGLTPVPQFDAQAIHDAAVDSIRDKVEPRPPADVSIETLPQGHQVVRIDVEPGDPVQKPYYVESRGMYNGAYHRIGEADVRLTKYEIDRLLENRTQPRYDEEIVPEASINSLSPTLVSTYVARLREEQPRVFAGLSEVEVLKQARILRQDKQGQDAPILGALLAMGTDPQAFFPQLVISVVVLPGTERGKDNADSNRFLDNRTCKGPIPVMVNDAMAVLLRNMRKTSVIQGRGSSAIGRVDVYEYPTDAIRELLVNAVMHRDYSPSARGTQVHVELYTDRLVVRSPGGIFGPVNIRDFGLPGVSSTRNTFLAGFLMDLPDPSTGRRMAENRASGIPTVFRAVEDAGLEPPVFVDQLRHVEVSIFNRTMAHVDSGGETQQIIPNHESDSTEKLNVRQRNILQGLREHGDAVSASYAHEHWGGGASRTSVGNDLKLLVGLGLVEATAPARSKNRKYRVVSG